jgi:hypothetical protein
VPDARSTRVRLADGREGILRAVNYSYYSSVEGDVAAVGGEFVCEDGRVVAAWQVRA